MARIPSYDSFQVDAGGAPSARFEMRNDAVMSAEAASIPGRQIAESGNNLQRASQQLVTLETEATRDANKVRVIDSYNQLKQQQQDLLYNPESGLTTLNGKNAIGSADKYREKLDLARSEIAAGLGNEVQRQEFMAHSNDLVASFMGTAMKHESEQYQRYKSSVVDGSVATAANDISLNFSDPNAVQKNIGIINAAAISKFQNLGLSEEEATAKARDVVSKSLMVGIGQAVQRQDGALAVGYLKKYASQMSGADLLHANEMIGRLDENNLSNGAVQNATQAMGDKLTPTNITTAHNIVLGKESSRMQWGAPGSVAGKDAVTTSDQGAIGIGQMLPSTAKAVAKQSGIPWDESLFTRGRTGDQAKDNETTQYNIALSKAYFDGLVRKYGGQLDKAFGAYHSGETIVDKAIRESSKSGKLWTEGLGPKGQAYVADATARFQKALGESPKATKDEFVSTALSSLPEGASPTLIRQTTDAAARRFDLIQSDRIEQDAQSTTTAINELVKNGGDYNALPASVRNNIPAGRLDAVMNFGKRVAGGQQTTNPAVYQRLTNTSYLNGLSDAQFGMLRADLSPQDYAIFSTARQSAQTGKAITASSDLPRSEINTALDRSLRNLGIDPSPKDSDEKGQMRMGAIKSFIDRSVLDAQRGLGRKMNDQEVMTHVNGLFAKDFKFRKTLGSFEYGAVQSMPILSMEYKDIPSNEREQIEDLLISKGVTKPSHGDILGLYIHTKMRKNNG